MANQQGALPDPQPACRHPATEDSADLEFAILDVESEILDVATALAARARLTTSMCATRPKIGSVESCESAQIIAKAPF